MDSAVELAPRVGAPLYSDVWPNRKVAKVAFLLAKGYSCTAIATELSDGTKQNQVASMALHWGISAKGTDRRHTYADVPVPLAAKFRTTLAAEASRRGIDLPELVARMAETICRDGLFGAVLDT
ncbi:hypothetical protein [Devosia sp. RR2S18]|uniref:hypothetical protein n=1 Tax=Devosia rhizosphaerae TaxID=3049774 RepID=UPI0025410936|nr:hypothetical protein [Devosia sp. RR2S18]WIJ26599.1 hypothetical protein QOV41_07565 [Devosia sp. RR2S18]